MSLRSFLQRPVVISPVAVGKGDDVVVSLPNLPAGQDAVGLLNTLELQFPRVRLHLLIGFGEALQVHRNDSSRDGEGDAKPELTIQQRADQALAAGLPTSPGGNIVLCTLCTDRQIIVVSIPPKAQGDAVPEAVFHGDPVSAVRGRLNSGPAAFDFGETNGEEVA